LRLEDEGRVSFEYEKAFFERVDVDVDTTVTLERAGSEPHVD
jgi:hypothetical protein